MSVQRTFPGTEMAAWDSLVSNNWLEGLTFNEGDEFKVDGHDVTVRAVRPGKLLRLWWQQGDEKSVIEVMLIPTKDKCAIRYRHYDLAEQGDVDIYRARWKDVLADITV